MTVLNGDSLRNYDQFKTMPTPSTEAEPVVVSGSKMINGLVIGLGAMAFGKEKRAVRIFKQLKRIRPYFFTSKWEDGSVSELLRANNLEFCIAPFGYLGRAKLMWTAVALLHTPLLWTKVLTTYVAKRCNLIVVISAGAFVNALPAILVLRFLLRARLVFYLGDSAKNYNVNRFVAKLINLTSDLLIANSESVKESWTKVGVSESSMRVVYNGIDVQRFERAHPYDFRLRCGWTSDTLIVGFAGQFRPNKGVQDFVAAAEEALLRNANFRFVVIGRSTIDDSFEREIIRELKEKNLSDRIVFVGWTDQIESFLKGIDVLVVPSRHEDPAPNINIEAMASGVPVIATKVGGTPEQIVHGETGLLCEKERPDQLAECLLVLASDASMRARMGIAGRNRVKQMFDLKVNAFKIEQLLIEGYIKT